MILVFPSAVVREPWKEAVSAPWEMSEWMGTEEFLPFSPPKFPLSGVWLQSVAPFWPTIPWIFEYYPPSPSSFFNSKLEARDALSLLWMLLRNLARKVASVLLQVLSGDVIRGVNGSFKQRHFPGAGFCHPVSVLSRECIIHHGYGRRVGSATACNNYTI